jgi:hypothetical protein
MSPREIDMRPYHSLNKAPGHLVESLERNELISEVQRLRKKLGATHSAPGTPNGYSHLVPPVDHSARLVLLEGQVRRQQQP